MFTQKKTYKLRWGRIFSTLAALVAVNVCAVYFFSGSSYDSEYEVVVEATQTVALQAAVAAPAEPEKADESTLLSTPTQGVIQIGDTAAGILSPWLDTAELSDIERQCRKVFDLRKLRVGQAYTVHVQNGEFASFEYEINNDSKLNVARADEGFEVAKVDIEFDIELHKVEGQIKNSLFQSVSETGEGASLAVALAEVFAWEINFIRDIQPGDSYSLLVEKRYRDGEFKGYGRLLAAHFTNQGKEYEGYLFEDDKGTAQYYRADGQSVRRAFLKAPLSFTRISSGYTGRRLHPVLMQWRSHPAIDYAAPSGTPVKAVGRGTVTFRGFNNASGNYVKVQHSNGYETMYLHLSSFAKGLKKGSHVGQGQVIGYVGATGYATGPHLDFRMKKHGQYVNPLKELSPRDNPVTAAERPVFMAKVAEYNDFLLDRRNLAEYEAPGVAGEKAVN